MVGTNTGLDITKWHPRAICPHCHYHISAPNYDLFEVAGNACVRCGCDKWGRPIGGRRLPSPDWRITTMRYVSNVKLLKPWTWGRGGYWETSFEYLSERRSK